MLWDVDEGLLFLTAIVAFLAVMEIAFRLGRRHGRTEPGCGADRVVHPIG